MEAFAIIGMSFGIMGFVMGGIAIGQINELKKGVQRLSKRPEGE